MHGGVAIYDPLPVFAVGLLATLGAGGRILTTEAELQQWVQDGTGTLFLTLPDDEPWQAPLEAAQVVRVAVVAVLEPFSEAMAVRALRWGASNVVFRGAAPEDFRRVLRETSEGRAAISRDVLRAATAGLRESYGGASTPSDEELEWLRRLASGISVAELASHVSFSERVMYRKLRQLYDRLKVEDRTRALMLAREQRWL